MRILVLQLRYYGLQLLDPLHILVVLRELGQFLDLLLELLDLYFLFVLYRYQVVVKFVLIVSPLCRGLEIYFKLLVLLPKLVRAVAVLLGLY